LTSYKAKRRKAIKRMNQPPRILTTIGLEAPPDFPLVSYEAIHAAVSPRSGEATLKLGLWDEYAAAWNAVAIRFLSAVHYADSFKATAVKAGIGTTHAVRFEEERAVFGFYANAIASLDAAYYGLYAIGAFLSPLYFCLMGIRQQHKVDCYSTYRAFKKYFPGDPIVDALNAEQKDAASVSLRYIRNVLAHRAAPPRLIRVSLSVGSDATQQPPVWPSGKAITPDVLTEPRADLARLLGQVLDATATFAAARILNALRPT